MKWQDIRERQKSKDRYYTHYKNPESFWTTLDLNIVAWTYEFGPSGVLMRILYSIIGCSNQYEPMPIGNRPDVYNLWQGWHPGSGICFGKYAIPGRTCENFTWALPALKKWNPTR